MTPTPFEAPCTVMPDHTHTHTTHTHTHTTHTHTTHTHTHTGERGAQDEETPGEEDR